MLPVWTRETNFVYVGPTPDIGVLPCNLAGLAGRDTFSVWEPTAEERQAIAAGANVRLGLYGARPIPPVSLQVVPNDGATEVLHAVEGIEL